MIRSILVVSALLFSSFACAGPKPLLILRDANGTEVAVSRAMPFTIGLPGNASTGFAWHVRDLDTSLFEKTGSDRFAGRDTVPGTSGTFYLDFMPRKKGVSAITLTYHRDFETDIPPEDSFRVTIRVK